MGPFQTIDLNAPNGAGDYFERYAEGMYRVQQDCGAPVQMNDAATNATIETALRHEVRATDLQARTAWRNRRLGALAVHKLQQDDSDSFLKSNA